MKRPDLRSSPAATLAQQRALIRSLIAQTGWAQGTPAQAGAVPQDTASRPECRESAAASNVIPFPKLRR